MMGEYLPKNFNFDIINNYSNNNAKYERINEVLNVSILKRSESIELPLIYYNGYKACDSVRCYEVFKTENNLVGVEINKNVTDLSVWYHGTMIYNITKVFSILSIVIFIFTIKKNC